MYKIAARGNARQFQITGGLREGYGKNAKNYSLDDVKAAHHGWQKQRKRIIGLLVSQGDPSYGWPENDEIHCDSEAGWVLSGGVNVQFAADQSDDEAREMLIDMAGFIAEKLGQTRVYLTFLGEDIILQAEDKQTPTGD